MADAQARIDAFLEDLQQVLKKHDVTLDKYAEYDGHDEYCGTRVDFNLGTDAVVSATELEELLRGRR